MQQRSQEASHRQSPDALLCGDIDSLTRVQHVWRDKTSVTHVITKLSTRCLGGVCSGRLNYTLKTALNKKRKKASPLCHLLFYLDGNITRQQIECRVGRKEKNFDNHAG